ncbi:ABC transporter ATP-binding protein [Thalassorhabdomicrobium marinisediminis]|uniref:ABC transporter ATP-binding protein n=1 Tax=Thalassorhabdomicrobium marinisediminis TaxID=2170577 RepID=A0A2T7FT57_9RHOB|nr:sn-glycerol-3-phosphate ABC transporter ATP-binding protein UgpC [Thalassorhabdomicrobium marinisediminis]PVA05361.1 ABC transporter ATP-binding protein [Thalassorhabdomicrobium marinisediminis]
MTQITIRNAERSYGALKVLRDVSLDIADQEFAVLLGPSGCGKSTLLSAIAGLDDLQSGEILFDGQNVAGVEPADRDIGMVFQSYALYPSMRVRDNLSFGLETQKLPKADIRKRVEWAADLLQITPLLDRKPSALSGGQRQRVAIGRALVREASLFLFDEPLSNLDAKLRTEMRVEIKALHQRLGATFIYVTHDQVEAMTLATRIAVINGGVIEQFATPEEIYNRPASLFVAGFIGAPPMNLIPAVVRSDAGQAYAQLADGALTIPGLTAADGTEIVVGIRPEDLALCEEGEAADLTGKVVVAELLGADTLVWIEVAGQRIAVRLAPEDADRLDPVVRLRATADRISVFDAASTKRLELTR